MNERLQDLLNKGVVIDRILIESQDEQTNILLKLFAQKNISLCFRNASRFCINQCSLPMNVNGLEIVDNKQKGWGVDSRYWIHDYEENRIEFYCEKIIVLTDP